MKTIEDIKIYLENKLNYAERMNMKYCALTEKSQFVDERYLLNKGMENYYSGQVIMIREILEELRK